VGVGYYVMSCRSCDLCKERQENYCDGPGGSIRQFNEEDVDKTITRGGFSNLQVTNERYVVHIPDALEMENAAPLLCAGITVYSPLKKHGMEKGGKRVGVSGLGGLGHLAVLFAKAMGNHVTVLSTSTSKKEEALNELGADAFLISKDQSAIQVHNQTLPSLHNEP
jgi:D-arabinose 1-dehydrogenase-like Zn-dependent alcohol dehydrogenase